MVNEMPTGTWKAIGVVRNEVKQWVGVTASRDVVSEIVVDSSLDGTLDGVDEFAHAAIIYSMMNDFPGPAPIQVHPVHREDLPLVGIFASRSPARPNPVAKTIVEIIKRQNNVLTVKGLDAINGTPVLDIMPYMPQSDSVANARVPPWVNKIYESLRKSISQTVKDINIAHTG